MKKVMYFIGCALFVAAMTVACGGNDNNDTINNDSTNNDSNVNTETVNNQTEPTNTDVTVEDDAAMMAAAQKVAEAACKCAADESNLDGCIAEAINNTADCIKYKDNAKFKSEVRRIALECIGKKAVKKGGNAAIDQYVPDGKAKDAAKNVLNNL